MTRRVKSCTGYSFALKSEQKADISVWYVQSAQIVTMLTETVLNNPDTTQYL